MINILLVDDQALLCEVLKTWLDVEADLHVMDVAHNGQEAIEKVEELKPDIVLMDIDMPKMDGLSATSIICQRFLHTKIIVLSGHDDDAYIGKSLRAGAKGYLLKNTTAEELVLKIRSVHNSINLLEPGQDNASLSSLEAELENLLETYRRRFQDQLEEYENSLGNIDFLQQLELKIEDRIQEIESKFSTHQSNQIRELEHKNQSSWESIRKELISVNSQFNQANRNLSDQFNQQINTLKQDLESQLSNALNDWSRQRAALQEWAVQRDEMRPSMEEYEAKNRHELVSVINPIRSTCRDMEKQIGATRNWMFITGVSAILALGFSSYLLISQVKSVKSNNSNVSPARGVTWERVQSWFI